MKRIIALLLTALLLTGCALAEESEAAWNLPDALEMTEQVTALFQKATEELMGVDYEPVGCMGEKDGVYCILCRATVVYPDAKPSYALVYVNDKGLVGIQELRMDTPAEEQPAPEEKAEEEAPAAEDTEKKTEYQYVMYLGTNDKDTNKPVFTQEEAMEKARNILLKHFGGYTIQEAKGGWVYEGTEYREYTLVIYLSDTTPEKIHAAADELIREFRQSSVLIQENPTRTEFYSSEN